MTELKLCPFCGSDDLSHVLNDDGDQSIWCENCSAAGPIHAYQTEAEAAWNIRTFGNCTGRSDTEVEKALRDWLNCADIPSEWMRCRDQVKRVLGEDK